jgi:CelD/BcsL family acetyltransferase involved in cellulose biosynthesis/predicted ATP-grasp superfamily ATP-dependent carboligase
VLAEAMTRATTLTAFRETHSSAPASPPRLASRGGERLRERPAGLSLHIYSELAPLEAEWRRFEAIADCTAFQTFDWLCAWQRHVGQRKSVRPVIVVGRFGDGTIAFLLPLCVTPGRIARRLCWLGQDLCDYNAPLLAPDFSRRVTTAAFLAAWDELQAQMQCEPLLRHDWIEFEKMPQMVGAQSNPFTELPVTTNPSGAHLTHLGDDWEAFYQAKRSSATRRRDRAKRRHMSQFGDIQFATAVDANAALRTLDTLMDQKSRSLARKGIADIFAPPGHREFYRDLISNPKTQHLVHISRLDIGNTCAAANLGIVFRDCYYHVLASFADSEVAHYGPGVLHLRELMAYAIARGLKRFDFTIGDEPYKLEWSDTDLKLYDYATTVAWRGLPARWSSAVRRRLKRVIKQTPVLWKVASSTRAAVGSLVLSPLKTRQKASASDENLPPTALACVMGDIDLVRPLALAGVSCAVVGRPGVSSLYSRYVQSRLAWDDYSNDSDRLVDKLVEFGKAQPAPPVLFYQEDCQVLFVSRFRDRLAQNFRFTIADPTLIEDLLDKARFQALAERHALPVPVAHRFDPRNIEPTNLGLRFPLIIKPLTRLDHWNDSFGLRKALSAENAEELRHLWPRLRDVGLELLAQEFVPGAESRIESYHCYVDGRGRIAGEFTGRKIRTYPAHYGHTTALETTETTDVRNLGRDIVERLALTGVAKLDFKRDPQGNLRLLEINPRFTLWHHVGAKAGINIPAIVYADLTGQPRPASVRVRGGVRWCRVWKDLPASQAGGISLTEWMPWMLASEAKSAASWDDPLPLLYSALYRLTGGRLPADESDTWHRRR